MKKSIENKLRNLVNKYKKYETIANKAIDICKDNDLEITFEANHHYTCNDTIIISESSTGQHITLNCSEKKIIHSF